MLSHPDKRKKPDEQWRATFKPFTFSRRLESWVRRNNAANENDVKTPKAFQLEPIQGLSDGHIYLPHVGDVDDDSDSSQYSDAHSNFDLSMGIANRISPLADDTIPTSGVSRYASNVASGFKASSNINGLSSGSNTWKTQASVEASQSSSNSQAVQRRPDPLRLRNVNSEEHFPSIVIPLGDEYSLVGSGGYGTKLDKGKRLEERPDWGSSSNPWATLDHNVPDIDERHALEAENIRLKMELQDLRELTRRQEDTPVTPISPRNRDRALSASSPPRSRRVRSRRRQDMTLFETTTLRDLVLKRLFAPHVASNRTSRLDANGQDTTVTLDTPLSASQIQDFTRIMNDVIVEGQNLKQPIALCAVCHLPKFKEAKSMNQNSYISQVLSQFPELPVTFEDFHPALGFSRCCRRYVCKACLSASIISGIRTQWAHDLKNFDLAWIKCPVPLCGHSLPLEYNNEVLGELETLGLEDAFTHVGRFGRANQLRAALQTLDPAPNRETMRRALALHHRLSRYGKMWPLLDDVPARDDMELAEVEIEVFPIDTGADGQGTTRIPIFTHLLRHRTTRECAVCTETHQEFEYGEPRRWAKIIQGFEGEWVWRILSFPMTGLLANCLHDLDICRTCIAAHIASQIETQGHGVVDNISCPTPDCHHKYTHSEIRNLADPETFAIYDRYAVLNSLSQLPNFRWCLGQGCTSGGLYDDPSMQSASRVFDDSNHIMCTACKFEMCFTCQVPWHSNMTCAQHGSVRAHGDPNYTRTQNWINRNTKPCPGEGCGVLVTKGEGCFHMTCSRCRFEFCWECLADWRGILNARENVLRTEGHTEGCYFRREGAMLPTQIMGSTIERGLRRLEAHPPPAW